MVLSGSSTPGKWKGAMNTRQINITKKKKEKYFGRSQSEI